MKHLKTVKAKKNKGQTALEYAMVTVAVSLVLLAAWNTVGARVQQLIRGNMLGTIEKQMTGGNATVPAGGGR